jgi:hypothetical protein
VAARVGLRRFFPPACRRARVRRRPCRPRRRLRPGVRAGAEIRSGTGRAEPGARLPHAGDHPRVRPRPSGRIGRGRGSGGPLLALLLRPDAGRRRDVHPAAGGVGAADGLRAAQHTRRAGVRVGRAGRGGRLPGGRGQPHHLLGDQRRAARRPSLADPGARGQPRADPRPRPRAALLRPSRHHAGRHRRRAGVPRRVPRAGRAAGRPARDGVRGPAGGSAKMYLGDFAAAVPLLEAALARLRDPAGIYFACCTSR